MELDAFSAELSKIPMTGGFVKQMEVLKGRYGEDRKSVV